MQKPLVRAHSNTAQYAEYENPTFNIGGNKPVRKGIVKERYKHPGLLEILEVNITKLNLELVNNFIKKKFLMQSDIQLYDAQLN